MSDNKIGPGLARFDFYPRDWILDTRDLSLEEKGAFIDLLAAMYARGGPLPLDPDELRRLIGCGSKRPLKRILKSLDRKGKIHKNGGTIENHRALEEIAKAHERIGNARSAAEARFQKVSGKFSGNSDETSAKYEGENEEKQSINDCPPTTNIQQPTHTMIKNQNSSSASGASADEYAFEGRVIRLTRKDLDTWRQKFSHINDLEGQLVARDAYLDTLSGDARKKWFLTTSSWLANKNEKAAEEKKSRDGGSFM